MYLLDYYEGQPSIHKSRILDLAISSVIQPLGQTPSSNPFDFTNTIKGYGWEPNPPNFRQIISVGMENVSLIVRKSIVVSPNYVLFKRRRRNGTHGAQPSGHTLSIVNLIGGGKKFLNAFR